MYEIMRQLEVDFILRSGSVDQENLNWMVDSPFIKSAFELGLNPNDTILDFGSHIGSWSLPLVKQTRCRSWCFEPDKGSLVLSRASAVLNQLDSLITFVQAGIGGTDGTFLLYESDETWGHTMVEGGGPYNRLTGRAEEIRVLSLSSALNMATGGGRTIVKINIEGAEYEMFEGSSLETLQGVDCWVGEIHYDLGKSDFSHCMKKLENAGFSVKMSPAGDARAILVAHRMHDC
jgi:FkbM family methyltransferase